MTEQTVYYWEVYCTTDSKYEYIWSDTEPTTCPINNGHTISSSPGPRVIDEISNNQVRFKEEEVPTKGYYRFKGYCDAIPESIPTGNITSIDMTWPYAVSILEGWFYTPENSKGDKIDCLIAEDTIIGAIGANVSNTDTTFVVSPTVLENLEIGWHVNLFNGIITDDVGECIDKNTISSTITVSDPPSNAYTTSPLTTYVRMTVPTITDLHIVKPFDKYAFAQKKHGSRYIPAGTTVKIKYTNNEGNAKNFAYNLEYLY